MASGPSHYLSNKLLDHFLRNTAYTAPTTVYVALFTTLPAADGTGGVEVSGGGYARQALTVGAAASGATSNTGLLDYGTASAPWGLIVGVGIYDALTVGNLLWRGAMDTSKVVGSGDPFTIPIGDLDLSFVDVA